MQSGGFANALGQASSVVSQFIPGGSIITSAVGQLANTQARMGGGQSAAGVGGVAGGTSSAGLGGLVGGAGGVGGGVGGGTGVTGNDPGSMFAAIQASQTQSQMFNLKFLQLQEDAQKSNREFSAMSNILKVRHDTAKNAIGNMK